jgi:dynein heavy chain
VSIENGTILVNSERYPLIIDPQLQGITWLKEKEKNNNLKLLRMGNRKTNNELALAIENGYSVVIENLDEKIEAILMPVISRSFILRKNKKILKFLGRDYEQDSKFKLFLQTKLSNPHYPPEI